MWGGKWVLADLIIHRGVISDAVEHVLHRTGNISPDVNRWYALYEVTSVLFKWPYLLTFLALGMYLLLGYIIPIIKEKKLTDMLVQFLPFMLLSTYGFLWILVTYQHAYENQKFSYRNLGVVVFAIAMGLIYSGLRVRKKEDIKL